jgi:NTE family protein
MENKNMTNFEFGLKFIKQYDEPNSSSIINRLETLKDAGKHFSDIRSIDPLTKKELQYVDLVQEGGGTLGISLVGYIFVLEYVGIRFLRLAGTSAGAINALFLAAIGEKHEPKSPELLKIMTSEDFNLFKFVDGSRFAKFMIRSLIRKDNWFLGLVIFFIVTASLVLVILPLMNLINQKLEIVYLVFLAIFVPLTIIAGYQFFKFKKSNFGINPGNYFLKNFLEERLEHDYQVKTTADLNKKARYVGDNAINLNDENNKLGLRYCFSQINSSSANAERIYEISKEYKTNNPSLAVDYCFIAADINNQLKVSFPNDAKLYWEKPEEVNPAKYVRASMAIPVFFEPFKSDKITSKLLSVWEKEGFDIKRCKPSHGVFIDGGSISNFPINQLHKANIQLARLPIFGVRIAESKDEKPKEINSLLAYAGRVINTIRGQEDKSFLRKYQFYLKNSVSDINTFDTKISWLNFNLNEKEKATLFIKGVETALDFLEKFDWDNYREERMKLYDSENQQ